MPDHQPMLIVLAAAVSAALIGCGTQSSPAAPTAVLAARGFPRSRGPRPTGFLSLLATLVLTAVPHPGVSCQTPVRVIHPSEIFLQPGDRVQLKIWREPDLSGEFTVQENGTVVFPKVGPLNVAQVSIDSLTRQLTAHYSASLRNPAVEITALRRVSVAGAVRNPGFYYADPTVTVQGAVALAGGVAPNGNQKRIDLLRGGEQTEIKVGTDPTAADSGIQSGDQIRIPERSWLSRNTALVASGITGAALVVAAFIRP